MKKTEYQVYKELMAKPLDELKEMYDKHQLATTLSYAERKSGGSRPQFEQFMNSYAGSTVAKYGIILLCVSMVCKTARRCAHIMKK